jgi:hypothetical protein
VVVVFFGVLALGLLELRRPVRAAELLFAAILDERRGIF